MSDWVGCYLNESVCVCVCLYKSMYLACRHVEIYMSIDQIAESCMCVCVCVFKVRR